MLYCKAGYIYTVMAMRMMKTIIMQGGVREPEILISDGPLMIMGRGEDVPRMLKVEFFFLWSKLFLQGHSW